MSFEICPGFVLNISEVEMNGEKTVVYRFKSFHLDLAERQLRQGGQPVPLTPKAFDVLTFLVERAGHLVEKEDLMQYVWPDSFVEETNVTRIVHTLRKLLGETDNGNKFIETVPRRGYRFVADVRPAEVDDMHEGITTFSPPSSSDFTVRSSAEGTRRKPPPSYVLALAGSLVAAAIVLSYYFLAPVASPARYGGKTSIAVLPIRPINTAERDEIYEIGIADSLINKISSMQTFVVRPLSAIRKYENIEQDPISAGEEQHVDFILSSSYQLANGKMRITSQLLSVADGRTVDTYSITKDTADAFALQDTIATEILDKLSMRFGTAGGSAKSGRGTTNEEAYRLYLQGMYLYDKRTIADAVKAVWLLDKAIEIDPNFAQAWAGKAHAHRSLGNFGGSHSPQEEYTKSINAIRVALSLNDNLADAHSALCENKFFYEWDFNGAERECKRAIELDPDSPLAHEIYARYLLVVSRFDESISEIKTAIDLEPASLFSQRTYGICLFYSRRNTDAVTQFKRIVEIDPNFTAVYHWLINSLLSEGNDAEAFDWMMRSLALQKADEETLQSYRKAYQTSGWPGVGRERVKRFNEDKIRSYFLEASLTAHTGDTGKAFEYLEKSLRRREWGIPYLRIDPSLDVLRSDPRFDDLVRRGPR